LLSALREFVLVGEAQEPGNNLPQIDDPRFGIATARKSRTVRRTWLDTFDWRLFRAGLTLELIAGRGTAELVLTGRDGELVASEPGGAANGSLPIRWPSLIDQLPPGPLRDRLERLARRLRFRCTDILVWDTGQAVVTWRRNPGASI